MLNDRLNDLLFIFSKDGVYNPIFRLEFRAGFAHQFFENKKT
jgi:hypothetical protein